MYTIYSKAGCIFCDAAMDVLDKRGISYEEIKVPVNEDAVTLFKERKWKTVPQIMDDNGKHIGGYEDLKLYLNEIK
jgi:glutaredoxin 3